LELGPPTRFWSPSWSTRGCAAHRPCWTVSFGPTQGLLTYWVLPAEQIVVLLDLTWGRNDQDRWPTSCRRRGVDRLVIAGGRTPSGSNQCASCGCLQMNGDLKAANARQLPMVEAVTSGRGMKSARRSRLACWGNPARHGGAECAGRAPLIRG